MNIDCTPEEARAFFGAPDVKPLQDALMQKMQGQFMDTMKVMDPAEAMRQWQSMSIQNFQEFQKLFWNAAGVSTEASGEQAPESKAG
jgi:superfamily I DNA/RNA helicase